MISSMLCMQVDQLQRQLNVTFSTWYYYTQPEVDILTRRNRFVINWYSFLGHEYSIFNAIVSRLITLKILKRQNYLDLLTPESPPRLCPQIPSCKNSHFAITFFSYKTQSTSKKTDIS